MTTVDLIEADVLPAEGKTGVLLIPKFDEGHAKIEWDSKDPKDVEAARDMFIKQKAKGYAAYRVDPKNGDKGEKITEFDPKAEKIIMIPAIAGG